MKKFQTAKSFAFGSLLLLLSLLFSGPAAAVTESPEEIATRLQNRYDTIQSLTFDFVQDTRGQLNGRPKTGSGKTFFVKTTIGDKKSGKMRWNYLAPDKQVLVSDGITFSMYFESMAQMIVTPADTLQQDLTYSFFTGSGNLLTDFTILPADQETAPREDTKIIKLIPTAKQSQVASIQLWVTTDSLIRRIEIVDQFDTITVLNFSNLTVNSLDREDAELMEHLFHFTPPKGTEIIEQ